MFVKNEDSSGSVPEPDTIAQGIHLQAVVIMKAKEFRHDHTLIKFEANAFQTFA